MKIQIFKSEQFGKLRGMNINGEAWLMATDVARRLGYTNPQKAIRDHVDEDDKTLNVSFTINGTTPVLINESGIYALILSSRLPGAREFKHWVTSVVLPQIRRTGGYIPLGSNDGEKEILAKAVLIMKRTIEQQDLLLEAQRSVDAPHDLREVISSLSARNLELASSQKLDDSEISKEQISGEAAEFLRLDKGETEIPTLPPVFKQYCDIAPEDFKQASVLCLLPILGTLTTPSRL